MFVVRVENDEATMYRAFRRIQTARAWAVERNLDDVNSLVDIFESADSEDAAHAVGSTRQGRSRPLLRGEAITVMLPMIPPASDIQFGRALAA